MTAKFQILVPEETTNIIRNPSAEVNLNDWLAKGSVIARTNDEARFGFASVEVTTNGAALYEGVQVRSFPNTIDTIYAGSVYVKGSGQVRVRMRDETNGNEYLSDEITLNANRWLRVSDIIGRTGAANCDNLSLHIETTRIQAITFYVDGADIEPLAYSTTYADGEQEGCEWEGTYHSSISIRNAYERSGGRFLDLDEDGIGVYATGISGVGMPPLRHNLLDRALIPGLEFQSTKVQARAINITLFARSNKLKNIMILHEKRSELINAIKPDIVSPTQPFILRYNGGSFPIDIPVYYEAGLEFEGDIRNENYNSFMMRLLATDPFWIEDNLQAEILDFDTDFSTGLWFVDELFRRTNGEWERPYEGSMAGAPNSIITAIAQAPNGDIYIGGSFSTIDGVAAVRAARYDGENWHPVATGLNSTTLRIAAAPNGLIYFVGNFTADGPGVLPLNYIAVYDPATDTMSQLGAGLNGNTLDVAIHPITGDIYVAGNFDDIVGGGGNTLNNIARWDIDTLTWNALGANRGLNHAVFSISFSRNGDTLYLGGRFADEYGVVFAWPGVYGGLARYYPDTDAFDTLGVSGCGPTSGDYPLVIRVAPSGDVYCGGYCETIDGITVNNIAVWNGTAWSAMAGGITENPWVAGDNQIVRDIAFDSNGNVVVVGTFAGAGDLETTYNVALWNGSSWVYIDFLGLAVDGSGDFTVTGVLVSRYDDIWLILSNQNAHASGINEINNIGSANTYPVLEVIGPGRFIWLENQTTRKTIYLNLFVHDGETVIIDLENNTVTSDWNGNRLSDVLPESDVADWFLAPGLNKIAAFIIEDEDSENTNLTITWKPRHWSFDGASE